MEADRARELASVQKEVGIVRANCKARGAIIGAKHAMRVVPVLHAAATRQLAHLSRLADPAERAAALVASASVGLTGGLEVCCRLDFSCSLLSRLSRRGGGYRGTPNVLT